MAAGRGLPCGMKMGWVPQSLTGTTQALTLNHLQVRRPSYLETANDVRLCISH